MLGRDHALTGAVVFAALAPALHVPLADLVPGVVLGAGAGVLPDMDHPDSTIADSFGFITEGFSRLTNKLSGGHRHGTHSFVGVAVFTAAAWLFGVLQQHVGAIRHYGHGAFAGSVSWGMIPALLVLTLLYASALRALKIGGHFADLIALIAGAVTCYLGIDVINLAAWHWKVPFLAAAVALGCLAHIAGDELTHGGCPVLWPLTEHEFHLLPKPMQITTAKMTEISFIRPLLVILLIAAVVYATGLPILHLGHGTASH